MREKLKSALQTSATRTVPAAMTKSIGLQANDLVVMVFACHLDNFIVTGQLASVYGDSVIWTISHNLTTHIHPFGLFKNLCDSRTVNKQTLSPTLASI
jgi:hypothetical protein